MGKEIRLDKFLADMGRGTRSQIREMAKREREARSKRWPERVAYL